MSRLKALYEERVKLHEDSKGLLDVAEKEDRGLTTEEAATWDKMNARKLLMLIYERDDHDDEIAQLEKAHEMQMQSLESINADWIQELMRKHEKEMAAFKDAFGGALRNLCGLGLGQIAVASSLCNIMQWLRDLLQLEDPC